MATNEKKVLVDVEIKATEALENLAKLKIRVAQLKEEQKALREEQKNSKPTNDEEVRAYQEKEFKLAEVSQQIKHQSTLIRSYEKEIQNNIIAEKAQGDSLDALKAKLSLATAEYNSLSKAARQDVYGQEKAQEIKQLTEELTEAETSLGNFHRQVGNYELAGKGLRTTIMDMTEELTVMKLEGRDTSAEYKALATQLATFKDAMGDVQEEAKKAASDTRAFDGLTEAVGGVIGAYGAYASLTGMLTESDNEYLESMKNMQIVLTALTSLKYLQNMVQKQSTVYKAAEWALDKLRIKTSQEELVTENALNTTRVKGGIITGISTVKEAVFTAAKVKGSIATKAIAVATAIWNATLLANPITLIIAGLAALVGGIILVTKWMSKSSEETKAADKAMRDYEATSKKVEATIDRLNKKSKTEMEANAQRGRQEVLRLKQNGASKEEIAKKELETAQRKRDLEIKLSKDIMREKDKEIKGLDKAIAAKRTEIATIKIGTDKYKEQIEVLNNLIKTRNEGVQTYNDNYQNVTSKELEDEEEKQRRREEATEKAKQAREKQLDELIKSLERKRGIEEKDLEYERLSKEKSFENDREYEEKLFKLQQDIEAKKLETQRRYGKITEKEYTNSLAVLSQSERNFNKQRENDLEEAYKSKLDKLDKSLIDEEKALRQAAKKEQAEWVAIIEAKYDEAYKQTEAYAIEYSSFIVESEMQLERDIEELKKNRIKKQIEDVEKIVKEQYEGDLQKYSDNEREKTKVEIAELEERIKQKREKGLSTYEDEANLRASQTKLNQIALNTELLNANLTAQQTYDLKKATLEAELELYKGNIDKEKELEAELAKLANDYQQQRLDNLSEWANKMLDVASELNSFVSALGAREVEEYEENNERKKASYQEQLDRGLISKEEYDSKIAQSEQELDRKKAEITRKQAIREKALKAFEILINTAAAIMKAAPNIALQVLTGITGATQLATVMATPIPKASKGMLLNGKSHAQGGVLIEAEGGEAIINKRSTMMYTPLLSAINQAGGGVAFDGGYARRNLTSKELSAKDIERIVEKTLRGQKIYVTVDDIRREDRKYASLEATKNW